jgi:hypothetical protein
MESEPSLLQGVKPTVRTCGADVDADNCDIERRSGAGRGLEDAKPAPQLMGSVPKPDYLDIKLDPMRMARRPPEQLWLFVALRWRVGKDVPGIISVLSEIPEAPRGYAFKVVRRGDGKYSLEPEGWEKPKIDGVLSLFDLARQDHVAFGYSEYLEYGSNLIKQYQPDFDYSESKEKAELLLHTLERVAKVRDSAEALRSYLWYSKPGKGKAVPWLKDPERDVKAAILQDVWGMNTLSIAKVLSFERVWKDPPKPWTLTEKKKRENATVRVAARRGRELLEYFYGAEGWRRTAARMRKERARWNALADQPKKQMYYLLAEVRHTSMEEEERAGMQDGFDQLLEQWIAAWDQGDQMKAENIQDKDPRFSSILYRL